MSGRSFTQRLRAAAHSVQDVDREDPWTPALRNVKGKVGHDGIERISTTDVFDILEVPMRVRPGLTVRLSGVMRQLGWSNIRARALTLAHTVIACVATREKCRASGDAASAQ